jgi:lipopolysaccharide cholinephosphotransferase
MIKSLKILDHKSRLRTSEELSLRKKEFLKICDILDKLKIRYYLQTGILLGAIRHNNFIPWDWDVEFSVFSIDLKPKLFKLKSKLQKSNFNIIQIDQELKSIKIDFHGKLPSQTTSYTIYGWNHDKKKKILWRKKFKVPDHFILNMKKIELFKKYHYAPYPPEKYLEFQYGNWKKPLQTSNKYVYMRKEYSGKNKIYDLFDFFLNSVKKLILIFTK